MEDSVLIRERYKVVRTVWQQRDYAAVEAVDIQDRETPMCLLNLYEGALLHRYGLIYSELDPKCCAGFRGAFLDKGTLVAAFDTAEGEPIDQLFFKGDKWGWQDRLRCAQELLHGALLLCDLPAEIACAALLSANVLLKPEDGKVVNRFLVCPMGEMNGQELVLLAQDQVHKILLPGLAVPDAQMTLLRRMDEIDFPTMAPLYSLWREILPQLQKEYESFEKMNFVQKGLTMLKRFFQRGKGGRKR